jgi:hypothetical protein
MPGPPAGVAGLVVGAGLLAGFVVVGDGAVVVGPRSGFVGDAGSAGAGCGNDGRASGAGVGAGTTGARSGASICGVGVGAALSTGTAAGVSPAAEPLVTDEDGV